MQLVTDILRPSPLNHQRYLNDNINQPFGPPGENSYKINFDGATFANTGTAGLGIIIPNNEGLPKASLSQKIPLPNMVIEVEILAARRALEFALELGFENVVLEGDSEILMKALKQGSSNLADYGHLIQDILFLSSHFLYFDCSFVRQLENKIAHFLARKANSLTHMTVWMEDVYNLTSSLYYWLTQMAPLNKVI